MSEQIGPPTPDEVLALAVRYAEAGVKIYPVFIRGLKPDGKKDVHVPVRWATDATDDLEQVRAWWDGQYRGAGIGIDMGRSGLAVADADVKDGVDGIARLRAELGELAVISRTPSGGLHAWFRDPGGIMGSGANIFGTKDQPSGVDGRGVGGTVFAAGTYVPGYGRYDFVDGMPDFAALPLVPEKLARACPPGGRKKEPAAAAPRETGDPFATASQLFASTAPAVVHRDRPMTKADAKRRLQPLWERVRDTRSPNGLWQAVADFALHAAHYQCFWDAETIGRMVLAAYGEGGHGYSALDDNDWRAIMNGYRLHSEARALGDLDEGWVAIAQPELADAVEAAPEDAVEALLAEMLTPDQIRERPPKRYLIKGLVHLDSEVWVIGAPGAKKSFVVLDQAAHVAGGLPWQGIPVRQGPVVIIAAEGAGGLGARVKAWEKEYGRPMPECVHILPRPVQASDTTAWAVLVRACERLKPVMVVGDTQARITVGLEENSATDMGLYVSAVGAVRAATGAAVFSVHHTGRSGGDARGSSAIDGAQDTELKVVALAEELHGEVRVEKQKDLPERKPIKIAFKVHVVGVDEDGDPITSLAVRSADAWLESEVGATLPEEWEVRWLGVQRQIIQVLADQGGQVGLTKAQSKANVADRWYAGETGRKSGLRTSTFDTAWTRVLEARTADGDPIVVGAGGQRYALDPIALKAYTEPS